MTAQRLALYATIAAGLLGAVAAIFQIRSERLRVQKLEALKQAGLVP